MGTIQDQRVDREIEEEAGDLAAPAVKTIGDIERKNSGAGQHFFDPDTLRFFASRIHEPVVAHRFFVTSEKSGGFEDTSRQSSIRMICADGHVETVGEFGQFATPAKARKALQTALGTADVAVRFDPYDTDWDFLAKAAGDGGLTEKRLFERFYWRAYVGGRPIGSRTTRTEARRMAVEAVTPCPL